MVLEIAGKEEGGDSGEAEDKLSILLDLHTGPPQRVGMGRGSWLLAVNPSSQTVSTPKLKWKLGSRWLPSSVPVPCQLPYCPHPLCRGSPNRQEVEKHGLLVPGLQQPYTSQLDPGPRDPFRSERRLDTAGLRSKQTGTELRAGCVPELCARLSFDQLACALLHKSDQQDVWVSGSTRRWH